MRLSLCPLLVSIPLALAACDSSAPARPAPAAEASQHVLPKAPEAAGVRFISRLTGGAGETEPLPLVVAIHGLGSRPEDLVDVYAQLGARARLVLPYGLEPYREGFSWFEIGSIRDPDRFAEGSKRAAGRLAAMIEEIGRRYPTAGKAIVTGFSQGGILSFTLAVLHPESVRAAFPVAGMLAQPLWPSAWPQGKEMPRIHAFHGTSDERIGIEGDRAVVARLREIGFTAEVTAYPGVGHTITPEMRRDLRRAIDDAVRQ